MSIGVCCCLAKRNHANIKDFKMNGWCPDFNNACHLFSVKAFDYGVSGDPDGPGGPGRHCPFGGGLIGQ